MACWQGIKTALEAGESAALVSIIGVEGSSPREVGARMVLGAAGGFTGTIGGGRMEQMALERAAGMLKKGESGTHRKKYLLGPDLGQCCGGTVTILSEIFTPDHLTEVTVLATAEVGGELFTLGVISATAVVRACVSKAEIPAVGLAKDGTLFEDFSQEQTAVYLFGAGHVGKALMLSLATLPLRVTWTDSREDVFPPAMPANFQALTLAAPHKALERAPDGAMILVMTHDHDMDFDIVFSALKMDRFAHIGLIGSKTKKARFTSKLQKAGLPAHLVQKLVCPIGIPEICSKKPAAIAVSVAADLLARIDKIQG